MKRKDLSHLPTHSWCQGDFITKPPPSLSYIEVPKDYESLLEKINESKKYIEEKRYINDKKKAKK